jgi:hypothetical protein
VNSSPLKRAQSTLNPPTSQSKAVATGEIPQSAQKRQLESVGEIPKHSQIVKSIPRKNRAHCGRFLNLPLPEWMACWTCYVVRQRHFALSYF